MNCEFCNYWLKVILWFSYVHCLVPFKIQFQIKMIHKIDKFTDFLLKNRRGCLCVLGSFLLSLALSLDYSYPNLNTYITSYLRTNGWIDSSQAICVYPCILLQEKSDSILWRLYICHCRKKPDPGPPELARGLHFHQARGQEDPKHRLCHPHVSHNKMYKMLWKDKDILSSRL